RLEDDVQICRQEALRMSTLPKERLVLSKHDKHGCHVWLDEQNVCNKERLRVLLNELEKRGFDCTLEDSARFSASVPLTLTIGLRDVGAWNNNPEPTHVKLDGVFVREGRLLTSSSPG
ncbi:unnamed protein product, partial [Polarella glacialis]